MLSCYELYRISEQLCKVRNKPDDSFGGMNMIFCGDFAQLPPVGGESIALYSHRSLGHCAMIGKALWNQVTYVVILRKNMRMSGESDQDRKYRTALENMRYKACTAADIHFLNTLISSNLPGRPSAKVEPWRSAPIIDEINRLGTLRFASETKQKLQRFYSDDTIATLAASKSSNKVPVNKKSMINGISEELQKIIWDLPTSSYDLNCPAILDICLGLPVIIRHNFATELSITKGQKGTVYAWHTTQGNFGQEVLETVFVLLDNPPSNVQIENLPLNVVPISRRKTSGYLALPDDTKICITRFQVDILPGFAMTAHASQGQSLNSNAVDLNTLNDHHAWYTALSRSRSAARTLILQGFDSSKITGGASGALRREYRELENLFEMEGN
ncbi:hypothetical protein F5880DRAFT_1625653 [Lentinula raphanica]|nr:hypothetical protein F5880DRAFT_1625653 [Lentinula raphanica]